MTEIVELASVERERAVDALVSAFEEDVMWRGLLPSEEERERVMPALWRGVLAYCRQYGRVYTTERAMGVSAWTAPGYARPSLWRVVRTRFLLMQSVRLMARDSRSRFMAIMKQIDALHVRLQPDPHWYLWALGVRPEHQRQGLGAALLEPVLERAAEEATPCYLETETETNVRFYRKQGFDVVHEEAFDEAGFRLWFMRKPPSGTG